MKLCEVQVSYRPKYENARHPQIKCSTDIEKLKWEVFDQDTINYRETFAVIFLNRNNRVLGISKMFAGGTAYAPVEVKMIVQQAILTNSSGIILTHNHPSGQCRPSPEDDSLTRRIIEASKLFDIKVLDHVIMSEAEIYSYADHGRL